MKAALRIAIMALLLGMPLVLSAESAGLPLPPLEDVLKRALDRAKQEEDNDRLFKLSYGYTRTRVTEFRNSKGDLKNREEKKGKNDPHLRAARHPQPDQAKPDQIKSPKDDEVTDTRSNVRGKAFEKTDFALNADLLNRYEFTLVGREMINDRPTLVVDFVPSNRKLPERNLLDRFINKAAGRVWVDEADYALVKADLRLTKRVNVVGGLVGAVWKFNYTFNRERTPDGLWFVRNSDWRLEGREVLVQRTVEYHEERTDVQKMR